jgi:thiamine-phosphate pyrophosphorylase
MIDIFTPAVTRSLTAAEALARHEDSSVIMPLHLLHGLLQDEDTRPFRLLCESGIDPAALRQFVVAAPRSEGDTLPSLPLADTATAAMHRAGYLQREVAGEGTLNSEHLLLGLLQEAPELRSALESMGLDWPGLENRELAALQGPPLALDEPLELTDPAEQMDLARIIDASVNRGREALRVIEDFVRFVLEDAFVCRELKTLRHDLAGILEAFPYPHLLAARDTLGDVGVDITTAREQSRHSLEAVVRANVKRLQEALRSLEEFGKVRSPTVGAALEQLRYRSYTVERMLLPGAAARQRLVDVNLYVLLAGAQCQRSLEETVRDAAAGGAQMFQLREKSLTDRDLLERARQVRRWTRAAGALFIMNDRPDVARLAEADGVHLGQDELPVREARRILGSEALVGVSTHNLEQLRQALRDGASYIGVGPTFPTSTKEFSDYPGLEFVRQAAAETTLPAFVIGGVTLANLPQVLAAGGRRVAVSGALCHSEAPEALARAMRQLLDAAR